MLFGNFSSLCRSVSPADLRFAETMDFRITPSTFLQFDIAMACDSLYGALYGVMLEYSVDMGQTWHPVVHQCAPPNFQCSGYHLSSEYMSDQHKNWTRVTLYMPPGAVLVDFSFDFIKIHVLVYQDARLININWQISAPNIRFQNLSSKCAEIYQGFFFASLMM